MIGAECGLNEMISKFMELKMSGRLVDTWGKDLDTQTIKGNSRFIENKILQIIKLQSTL